MRATREQSTKKVATVCASGPSITQKDIATAREISDITIAINDTYRLGDFDHLYAADFKWWSHHISDIARDFEGQCWSCEPPGDTNWGKNSADAWGVKLLRACISGKGLSRNKEEVHTGGNSGYQGINLAYHLGATRIILLGFDMHCHSQQSHFFGDHPDGFVKNPKYERFIPAYHTIKPEEYGIEILNCSRETALDAFPRCNLEDLT